VGETKLKHFACGSGAEFLISSGAEKVALESSPGLRNHMFESAKQSDDHTVLTITLPEGKPVDPTTGLILQFKPRSEVLK
jgi:hypothetical protein